MKRATPCMTLEQAIIGAGYPVSPTPRLKPFVIRRGRVTCALCAVIGRVLKAMANWFEEHSHLPEQA